MNFITFSKTNRIKKFIFCFSAYIFLFLTNSIISQTIEPINESFMYGEYDNVKVVGTKLYSTNGYGLKIFDISSPDTLIPISNFRTEGISKRLSNIGNNYIVLSNEIEGSKGIEIIDVQNPINPKGVWSYEIQCYDHIVRENRLYAACEGSIKIFDINDPTNPILISSFILKSARRICLNDNMLYAIIPNQLFVINISDEINPVTVGRLILDYNGEIRYLTYNNFRLYTNKNYDISISISVYNPSNPYIINELDLGPIEIRDFKFSNDYFYTIGRISNQVYPYQGILKIGSISNTDHPQVIAEYELPRWTDFKAIDINNDYAYVSLSGSGIQVIDCSNLEQPTEISWWTESITPVMDISLGDNYAITACSYGIKIYDLSTPQNPSLVSSLYGVGYYELFYSELVVTKIFIINKNSALAIQPYIDNVSQLVLDAVLIETSDLANPVVVGALEHTAGSRDFFVNGDFLYCVGEDCGFTIYNISDPFSPKLILNTFESNFHGWGVSVVGKYAYITVSHYMGYNRGLYIFDISDPDNLIEIGHCKMRHGDIEIKEDFAFIVTDYSDLYFTKSGVFLQVVSITDPSNPYLIKTVEIDDKYKEYRQLKITIKGNYAYISMDELGFKIVDISDPHNPNIVAKYDTPGYTLGLDINNDYIYTADYYDLGVYKFEPAAGVSTPMNSFIPDKFYLSQNYPNPFNPTTKIQYQLPEACHTSVKIYNIYGQEIKALVDQNQQSGIYSIVWDGKNNEGMDVSSGCYIYTIQAGDFRASKKAIFLH